MEWLVNRVSIMLAALADVITTQDWKKPLAYGAAAFAMLFAFQAVLASHWRLGIDSSSSRCLPYYLYLMHEGDTADIKPGELIRFDPEKRMNVEGVGLLNRGKEVIKLVAATEGDTVQVTLDSILINGEALHDSPQRLAGTELEQRGINPFTVQKLRVQASSFERTFVVPQGHLFVVGTVVRSFDSRYWGTIPTSVVKARVRPLL